MQPKSFLAYFCRSAFQFLEVWRKKASMTEEEIMEKGNKLTAVVRLVSLCFYRLFHIILVYVICKILHGTTVLNHF